MKLSISIPDPMAHEIKVLATQTDRDVSWWVRKAWEVARTQLLRGDAHQAAQKRALKKLSSLRGALSKSYPDTDSVRLSHEAFLRKR